MLFLYELRYTKTLLHPDYYIANPEAEKEFLIMLCKNKQATKLSTATNTAQAPPACDLSATGRKLPYLH